MDRFRYLIGVVTLLLAGAGGLFLFSLLGDEDQSQFFRLNVEFRSLSGLQPGAVVKYRGVVVGNVRDTSLRDDGRKAIATVVLRPGHEELARTNSRLWIVTPRFGGITRGASGLETLVRDAYLSFLTPDPWGPPLANGSSVQGQERPQLDDPESALEPVRRGDLLMRLLVPENYGLEAGSEIRYRGMRTGEVRSVTLVKDGSHVELGLRIDREHRRTVTDKTRFWLARPRLSGALLGGFSIDDVSALLIPFVAYFTEPGEGLPVPDGYITAAEVERPPLSPGKVGIGEATPATPAPLSPTGNDSIQLVQIVYEAIEEDWISPNDEIRREGTGILYEDNEGRLLVLTARSLCDAAFFETDLFGSGPEVGAEGISVVLPGGTVHRALRTWAAVDGGDQVLLVLDSDLAVREGLATTPMTRFDFDVDAPDAGQRVAIRALTADSDLVEVNWTPGSPLPDLTRHRGAACVQNGVIIGLLAQDKDAADRPAIVPARRVPAALRPAL
ncbi:MAG: MlaD family protein [Planctomycetota bacterium]